MRGQTALLAGFFMGGAPCMAQLTNPIPRGTISIKLENVFTFPSQHGAPIDLTHDGSTRIFIGGQGANNAGTVRLIKNGILQPTNFLSTPITTGGERGLLGFTFHPDYNTPGAPGFHKLYTYSSEPRAGAFDFSHPELGVGGDHDSVVREWTAAASGDVVQGGSREVLRIVQPQSNHNGGAMKFGPDKLLYIALGDGGGGNDFEGSAGSNTDGHTNSTGNGQDITNVYGKILRIDPLLPSTTTGSPNPPSANNKYRVPTDNPFVGVNGVDEIFAYG